MNWGKSCGETTSPELQRYLAARKHQTLGEKGVFLSWCCSGCGALVARWASCWSWLYQRRKRGQKYPGTCQFYNSHSGKCQFYNNHSGKAGKYSDSVNNSLDILPFFFFFLRLAAAKTFAGCYFAYWGAALGDYLSQWTTAFCIFQHDLDGQVFG